MTDKTKAKCIEIIAKRLKQFALDPRRKSPSANSLVMVSTINTVVAQEAAENLLEEVLEVVDG